MKKVLFVFWLSVNIVVGSVAQEQLAEKPKSERSIIELEADEKPTVALNPNAVKENKEKKKTEKKRKSNVFYGIKTKKRVVKTVEGNTRTYEIFYVLREYQEPTNLYADDYFYYDAKERKIVKTDKPSSEYGMPLHGTYKKITNGEVTLNGIFYLGTRHGRWEQYSKKGKLIDKKKYYEGFPREAQITYWDGEQKKIKEILPIHYGHKEGTYLRFYESGRLAEKGLFKEDVKVGLWLEFYDKNTKNNTKRQVKYPEDPFAENRQAVVLKEWDEKGNQTIGKSEEWKNQHKHASTTSTARQKSH